MNLTRMLLLASFVFGASALAADQPWPAKPLRFVVPFAVGGATDITTRLLAQSLTTTLGQPVVVDNRTGASGNIANEFVAKSPADGYTLLFGYAGTISINPYLFKNLPFDPLKDFAGVTPVAYAPLLLLINPSLPAKDVAEFVVYAKANPDKLFFGSGGIGGTDHLAGELFKARTGIAVTHVGFKGGAPALLQLMAGRTQMQVVTIPGALPHIRAGKVRALAIISSKRFEYLPDVPTIVEAGLPNFEINNWYGVLVPAGTPPPIIRRLNADLVQALQSTELRQRFLDLGLEPKWSSPEEFSAYIKGDARKWEKIVLSAGVTPE